MTYRPDHIYMGGMLRQTEFSLRHTDKGRVETVVSQKGGR
jgi:copper homeostasis protein